MVYSKGFLPTLESKETWWSRNILILKREDIPKIGTKGPLKGSFYSGSNEYSIINTVLTSFYLIQGQP